MHSQKKKQFLEKSGSVISEHMLSITPSGKTREDLESDLQPLLKGTQFEYHRFKKIEKVLLKLKQSEIKGRPGYLMWFKNRVIQTKIWLPEIKMVCYGIGNEIELHPKDGLTIVSLHTTLKLEHDDPEVVKMWINGLRKCMGYTDEQMEELRRCDNAMFTLADQDYNTPMDLPQLNKMRSQSLMDFSLTAVEGQMFTHHHDDGISQIMLKLTYRNTGTNRIRDLWIGKKRMDFSQVEAVLHGANIPKIVNVHRNPINWFTLVTNDGLTQTTYHLYHDDKNVVIKWVRGMGALISHLRGEDDADGDALPEVSDEEDLPAVTHGDSGLGKNLFNQWEEAFDSYERKQLDHEAQVNDIQSLYNQWDAGYDSYERKQKRGPNMNAASPISPLEFASLSKGSFLDFQSQEPLSDFDKEVRRQMLLQSKRESKMNVNVKGHKYLVTDSSVNLLTDEFVDRRHERYEAEYKRLYDQLRITEHKEFVVGDKVEVRQWTMWREGVVTSVNPLKVQPEGWSKSFQWQETRRRGETEQNWKDLHNSARELLNFTDESQTPLPANITDLSSPPADCDTKRESPGLKMVADPSFIIKESPGLKMVADPSFIIKVENDQKMCAGHQI